MDTLAASATLSALVLLTIINSNVFEYLNLIIINVLRNVANYLRILSVHDLKCLPTYIAGWTTFVIFFKNMNYTKTLAH